MKGFQDLGERFGIAEGLQVMAALSAAQGHDKRAAELAGAAHAMWASMSAQALASDRPLASRYLDLVHQRLGGAAWRSAWQGGQLMSTEAAVQLALQRGPAARSRMLPAQDARP